MLEFDESKTNTFSISNCDFANDGNEESSNIIYFVGGKISSEVEINDCKFKGKLKNGSHYIEGKLLRKDQPKLQIKSCQFDSDDNSVNLELVNDLESFHNEMNVDLSSNLIYLKGNNIMRCLIYIGIFSFFVFLTLNNNEDRKENFNGEEL